MSFETLLYKAKISDPTLTMHDRRRHTVPARRHGRSLLARRAAGTRRLGPRTQADFPNYASGSAGPASSDTLLAMGGRSWRPLHSNNEPVDRKASRAKADTAAQPATTPAKKRAVAKKRTATKKAASKKVAAKKVIAATVAKKSPARKTATKKTASGKRTTTTRTRGK